MSPAASESLSNHNVDVDTLYVKAAWVDGAQTQKRFLPRAHGRATRIIKRSSHVTIVVDEKKKD